MAVFGKVALILGVSFAAVSGGAVSANANDFAFSPSEFGRQFNETMRRLDLSDRVSFDRCREAINGNNGRMFLCQYNFEGAQFYVWSPAAKQPARWVVVSSDYDAAGADALQLAAAETIIALRPGTDPLDAMKAVNSGLDQATDAGRFKLVYDTLMLQFRLDSPNRLAKIIFSLKK